VSQREVRSALDGHFRDTLLPVTGGLVGIFFLFTVANYLILPQPVGLVTATVNLGLAIVSLFLHVGLRMWGLRPQHAHLVGTLLALAVLADSLLPLFWLEAPVMTTYLILVELGAAVFFLNWFALAVTVAITDAAWVVAFLRAGYDFDWAIFGLCLATATILAGLAHHMRMVLYTRYALLHLADDDRRRQLELAADVASQSERRFRSLVEATSEGIIIVDEGRIIDHNGAFVRIFGWPAEEVPGRRLADFVDEASCVRIDQVRFSGTRSPLEANGVHRDGSVIPLQVSIKLAPFQGRFVSLMAIRDLPRPAAVQALRPYRSRRA